MNNNNQVFKAVLTTEGRKTGKEHSVWLRAVRYNDRIYFSRHKPDGDWFQNGSVTITARFALSDH